MTPERWTAIRRVFDDVVSRDPAVHAALLADRCGFDLALRGEVEALLAADREARDGRFLRDAVRAAAARLLAVRGSGRKGR